MGFNLGYLTRAAQRRGLDRLDTRTTLMIGRLLGYLEVMGMNVIDDVLGAELGECVSERRFRVSQERSNEPSTATSRPRSPIIGGGSRYGKSLSGGFRRRLDVRRTTPLGGLRGPEQGACPGGDGGSARWRGCQ